MLTEEQIKKDIEEMSRDLEEATRKVAYHKGRGSELDLDIAIALFNDKHLAVMIDTLKRVLKGLPYKNQEP